LKDITIKGTVLRRELIIWLILLVSAFVLNIYAIVVYDGELSEIFTQMHIVVIVSLAVYIPVALIRVCYYTIKLLFNRKVKQ